MKRVEGDGISCDYCGQHCSIDFTYYSLDFNRVGVVGRVQSVTSDSDLSADLCSDCMELYKKRVVEAYTKPIPNQFACDVSGQVISDANFIFYHCKVSKVVVNLSLAKYNCSDCGKIRELDQGPCENCTADTKFVREAQLTVDDKFLDINFSQPMFDKFRNHIEFIKSGETEWSSSPQQS